MRANKVCHPTHNSDPNSLHTLSDPKVLREYINSLKLVVACQSRPGPNMGVPIRIVISVVLIVINLSDAICDTHVNII